MAHRFHGYVYITLILRIYYTHLIYIQISSNQDECNIYATMKTMCHTGYHHYAFVALHLYGYTLLITGRAHWFHNYIYQAHLASVRLEYSVCCEPLMTTYITLITLIIEHFLVHWYHKCVTVNQVPKWPSAVPTKSL